MRYLYKIIFLVLLNQSINPQSKDDSQLIFPYPIIGWDSLKSLIEQPQNYPDILRRAGVNATLQFLINVDSSGILTNVQAYKVQGIDSLFIPVIDNIIRSVKWEPGSRYGKYYDNQATLFFTFYLYFQKNPQFFLIGAPAHLSEKSH